MCIRARVTVAAAGPGGAARAGGSHGHLRPGWGSVEAWAGGRADTLVRAAPRWLETAGVPAGRAGLWLGRAAIRRPGRWPSGSPARPSPVRPRRPPASVGAGPGVAVAHGHEEGQTDAGRARVDPSTKPSP